MWVEALPESLLVYQVPSSRQHQGQKAVFWVVWILNDHLSLILAMPGVYSYCISFKAGQSTCIFSRTNHSLQGLVVLFPYQAVRPSMVRQ